MPSRRVAKRTRGVRAHVTPSGGGGVVRRAGRDAHQQICPWLSRVIGRATKPLLRGRLGRAGLKAGANLVTSDLRRQAEVTVMIGCESICGADRITVNRQTLWVIRGLWTGRRARRPPERPPSIFWFGCSLPRGIGGEPALRINRRLRPEIDTSGIAVGPDFVLADQIRVAKVFDWLASLFVPHDRHRSRSHPIGGLN